MTYYIVRNANGTGLSFRRTGLIASMLHAVPGDDWNAEPFTSRKIAIDQAHEAGLKDDEFSTEQIIN